ncbi:MAG: hypothetical protein Q9217_006435 [Psora testacea]
MSDHDLWSALRSQLAEEVGDQHFRFITSVRSHQELAEKIEQYKSNRSARVLEACGPTFQQMDHFNDAIKVCVSSHPEIAALICTSTLLVKAQIQGAAEVLHSGDSSDSKRIIQKISERQAMRSRRLLLDLDQNYHSIPLQQNPDFLARDVELSHLRNCLRPDEPSASLIVSCIYGLSGVGKTHLALEFAYQSLHRYDVVCWFEAESSIKIMKSLREHMQDLNILESDTQEEPENQRKIFKRWLRDSRRIVPFNQDERGDSRPQPIRWLLIFDNVEDFSAVESIIPTATQGSIIVTTQVSTIAPKYPQTSIELRPFDDQQAKTFLLAASHQPDAHQTEAARSEQFAAERISQLFGNLPKALAMVRDEISVSRMPLAKYLEMYPKYPSKEALHMPYIVAYKTADSIAQLLLQLIVFFDPDGVETSIFHHQGENQKYLQERGQYAEASVMVKQACQILEYAVDQNDHPYFSHWRVKWLLSDLYSTQGTIDYETSQPGYGIKWTRDAKALRQMLRRPNNVEDEQWLLQSDANLSCALMALVQNQEALTLTEHLLANGKVDSRYEIYLTNASICYRLVHNYRKALEAVETSMALSTRRGEARSLKIAIDLFNLGSLHLSQMRIDDALESFTRCLNIRVAQMPYHYHTGLTYHKLACIMRAKDDPFRAVELFENAVAILENASESQPAAYARSAFSLSEALSLLPNSDANRVKDLFDLSQQVARSIPGINEEQLPSSEQSLDRWVLFCYR